ncbi:hypothetical protein HYPDE_28748 [Hyphomicrobium denitrificans 1NES1]|uniref:Uncharacterized protein n=1 Tax=Hyphomicrobium denitrificans 1NES1 TaxID=670307 RepID=N0B1S4_9HYPH|nr:hypothetical protein HYPDE_28748 [Hyphomicrobium denitrificans 1NES1]
MASRASRGTSSATGILALGSHPALALHENADRRHKKGRDAWLLSGTGVDRAGSLEKEAGVRR